MAVFTPVAADQAAGFLASYDEGRLLELEPIAEGVENTNYRLVTSHETLVLTLFEKRIRREDLPFCLGLTEHLARGGFPTPSPVRDRSGELVGELNGRPAALVRWAPGAWPRHPSAPQARQAGEALARIHALTADFPLRRDNPVGPEVWRQLRDRCGVVATGEHAEMLQAFSAELEGNGGRPGAGLPSGPIHADYFPDNVLYAGGGIGGVIDFYFACTGALAYDLAIALNAWGFAKAGELRGEIGAALLGAYEALRPLTAAERKALPGLCRAAAIRFGFTRLHDLLYHPPDAQVTPKDPRDYLTRLTAWRNGALDAFLVDASQERAFT